MTWHQWHQTASRSRSTKRFSRLASAKTLSDQGCQFRWGFGGAGCWASAGKAISSIRRMARNGVLIVICKIVRLGQGVGFDKQDEKRRRKINTEKCGER